VSKLPDWLDPATLRWCADEESREAAYWYDAAVDAPNLYELEQRGYAHKIRAQRLRNIATRIERRRAR